MSQIHSPDMTLEEVDSISFRVAKQQNRDCNQQLTCKYRPDPMFSYRVAV